MSYKTNLKLVVTKMIQKSYLGKLKSTLAKFIKNKKYIDFIRDSILGHSQKNNTIKITKENLNRALEYFFDLNFTDGEYNKMFNKLKPILKCSKTTEISKKTSKAAVITDKMDFKSIVKNLSEKLNSDDLSPILNKLIKNEELVNFIQDLILEKML